MQMFQELLKSPRYWGFCATFLRSFRDFKCITVVMYKLYLKMIEKNAMDTYMYMQFLPLMMRNSVLLYERMKKKA